MRAGWLLGLWWCGCGQFHAVGADGGELTDDLRLIQPGVDGGALRAVWGSGAGDVHAVGDDGTIVDWDGANFYHAVIGSGQDLNGVWGSGAHDIFAVGTERITRAGVILHRSADTWVEMAHAQYGLKSVWGVGDLRYAVGLSGAVYQGPSATPFSTGMQIEPDPVVPPGPDSPVLYSIGGNSAKAVMVAGDVDATYFFDGMVWHAFLDPVDRTRTFRAIWGAAGDTLQLYEGANYFGIWLFTGKDNPVLQLNEEKDDPIKAQRFIWSMWGPSGSNVVFVGDEGRIMTYDAVTQKVARHLSPTTRNLYGIWGASLDDVWIVGEGGVILRGRITVN